VRLARDAFKILQFAALANEEAQLGALRSQRKGHMMAYESRRACEKYLHSLESLTQS
jgi:hypothetical protein